MRNQSSTDDFPFAILVHVQVKPDRLEEFKKAMAFNSEQSRLESGCYRFDTLQDAEDPCKFTFYEVYKNPAALEEHKKTAHYDGWVKVKESGAVVSQSVQKFKGLYFGY